jgi:hypothetical protein
MITLDVQLKKDSIMAKTKRRLRKRKPGKNQANKKLSGVTDMACRECGGDVYTIPADVKSVLCSICLAQKIPAPKEKKTFNPAKRAIRKAKVQAESAGDVEKLPNLPKGWHRRKFFKIKIVDKWYYFVKGNTVTRADFFLAKKEQDTAKQIVAPHSGYGRGWHLKKRFVAPDGKIFEYGKEVKK